MAPSVPYRHPDPAKNRAAAQGGPPPHVLSQKHHTQPHRYQRRDERDEQHPRHVGVPDQPVVRQKRDHRADDGQIGERHNGRGSPIEEQRISLERGSSRKQRHRARRHLHAGEHGRIEVGPFGSAASARWASGKPKSGIVALSSAASPDEMCNSAQNTRA
jgi:hypothetical protein